MVLNCYHNTNGQIRRLTAKQVPWVTKQFQGGASESLYGADAKPGKLKLSNMRKRPVTPGNLVDRKKPLPAYQFQGLPAYQGAFRSTGFLRNLRFYKPACGSVECFKHGVYVVRYVLRYGIAYEKFQGGASESPYGADAKEILSSPTCESAR